MGTRDQDPTPRRPAREPEPSQRTEDLNRRHQQGSESAGRELFPRLEESLRPAVRRHPLFRLLATQLEVDDVLNELWGRLLAGDTLGRFEDRGPGSLRAYVRTCLQGVLVDLVRRSRSSKALPPGHAPGPADGLRGTPVEPAAPGPGPATVTDFRDLFERCRAALPPGQREVWCLRSEEGLEFEEIARRTGQTAAAARGHYHRARARLVELGIL